MDKVQLTTLRELAAHTTAQLESVLEQMALIQLAWHEPKNVTDIPIEDPDFIKLSVQIFTMSAILEAGLKSIGCYEYGCGTTYSLQTLHQVAALLEQAQNTSDDESDAVLDKVWRKLEGEDQESDN